MPHTESRTATRWLLAVPVALLLIWLALPRLVGLAAERWLDIPGLESLHVDMEQIGPGHARLREVSGVYRGGDGQVFRVVMHDIALDYSPLRSRIDRLEIARAEVIFTAGRQTQASPWPRLDWPELPLGEAHVGDLRVAVKLPGRPSLATHGSFRLRQTGRQWQAEFRPDGNLLRATLTPGETHEIHAEWLPKTGPLADALFSIGRQPARQAVRLVAHGPLLVLADLGRFLGIELPLTMQQGGAVLKAEALLGETTGSVAALSGEAEFADVRLQAPGIGLGATNPSQLSLAGGIRFDWKPSAALLEMLPGLRWQFATGGEQSVQASGRLVKPFSIRLDHGSVVSEAEFPFALQTSQWGRWSGAVHRIGLNGKTGLSDWSEAEMRMRIQGGLKQWQQDAVQLRDMRAVGNVALHWSRQAGLRGEMDLQIGVGGLSWPGESPLSLARSTWKVNAGASASTDGNFRNSLVMHGVASSPQLKLTRNDNQTLMIGLTRLQLSRLRPAGRGGAEGELLLSADALRIDNWPSPDLRVRLRLAGDTLRADGTVRLHGEEVFGIVGSQALSHGCGEAMFTARHDLSGLDQLLRPRPPQLFALELQSGEAEGRFTLDWCTKPRMAFDIKGGLQVRNAAFNWERARVEGVQADLQLDGMQPMQGRIRLSAQRGALAAGTPMSDLNVDLAVADQVLTLHDLRVKLLGGSVYSEPSRIELRAPAPGLSLKISGIDLGLLLDLFKQRGLTGSGRLDGNLPLIYRDGGVEISDARLDSQGAGTLKYAPGLSIPTNPGLLALRNFHFRKLGVHVWYGADGAYRTQAKLEGSNPDFYNGYPIRFGLNINGTLPGLLRSAIFSGDYDRQILKELQSGKLQ